MKDLKQRFQDIFDESPDEQAAQPRFFNSESVKLEFLVNGRPSDVFWSQGAIFRQNLDALGDEYRRARLVLAVRGGDFVPLPERWRPFYESIEVEWDPQEERDRRSGDRRPDFRYGLIDPSADLSFLCDADTMMLRPFPEDFFSGLQTFPAVCGVIAPGPPSLISRGGGISFPADMPNELMWGVLADFVLGGAVPLDFDYTLVRPKQTCPFFVNPGLLAGPPRLLKSLYDHLRVVEPQTRKYLDNYFTGQVSIAFAVERGLLPVLALPVRYNFPDSPTAARLYPDEFKNVILMRYVNTRHFDPKRIFASETSFDYFMSQPLFGRNKLFQEHVRELTGGVYPFLL